MHRSRYQNIPRQRGVSLLELLVTLVVTSVGLLSIAALHLVGLRNNLQAHFRSQASVMAADIADRMRANSNAARASGYTVAMGRALPSDPQAVVDVSAWKASLAQLLPNGDGGIAQPMAAGPNKIITITVQWLERLTVNAAPVPIRFEITTAL